MNRFSAMASALAVALLTALFLLEPASMVEAATKPHHQVNGLTLLKDKGLLGKTNGTHPLHHHKGHTAHVTLKKGKVAGMVLKTPDGKTLHPKVARRVAALPLEAGDTIPVSLGGTITFTFQTPFFTITFSFPADAVSPDAGGTGGDDPGSSCDTAI